MRFAENGRADAERHIEPPAHVRQRDLVRELGKLATVEVRPQRGEPLVRDFGGAVLIARRPGNPP